MNGKKAKLLRKVGKVDKKTKKMYNSLTHVERGVLTQFYNFKLSQDQMTK